MPLSSGSRLGVYEILSVIGEGGMGRVYRGRDTKLQRDVAIKVLPEDVAGDPERVARFEREARTLASLNHPHIAQIYGTEQSGPTHALVMELVEGEDLSQRIARGPIPWREAEPIAKQIAEALETAHEQGIVHRDLKPANIKITPDGVVKVLDFGLAKAVDATRESSPVSATITSPAALTQAGFILGTAAYMSPEQAKGRPADKRSDVWAFGCVLYEMVTGKRAFAGDDVVDTLAAVVRADPDLAAIPADVPPAIGTLITRCLIKDRKQRVADIAVARYALESTHGSAAQPAVQHTRNPWPGAIVATAAIVAVTVLAMYRRTGGDDAPQTVVRSTIAAPAFGTGGLATIAMSRQGTHLAYATAGRLALHRLDEAAPRLLLGSEGGTSPFFSHDGEWLAFFSDSKLKKIRLSGGAAQTLADAPSGRGGSWGPNGTVVFAPDAAGGLKSVSADGGSLTTLTTVKSTERSHRWPHVLPDGRHVVFTIQFSGTLIDDAIIATIPIGGGEPRVVLEGGSSPQFIKSGHLIYGKAANLLATELDPTSVRASGGTITVIEGVRMNGLNGAVPVAVSAAGSLVYVPGVPLKASMSLLTADRIGQTRPLLERRTVNHPIRISPEGKRVAVSMSDPQNDIWIVDLENGGLRRFTLGGGSKTHPVWSPDGARVYYLLNTGVPRAVSRLVSNDGSEDALSANTLVPMTVSHDGAIVAGRAITSTSLDIVAVDVRTKRDAPIAATPANESDPAFSPDGRYLAYQSDESGRNEVYVQEYPSGSRWQVTTNGGSEPRWTSGGREIVYRNGTTLFALAVTPRPFSWSTPKMLFSIPNLFAFDVTTDGQRFVVAQDSENAENVNFVLITGWFEELKAKMRPSR